MRSRRRSSARHAAGNALWYRIPYTVADRDKLPDDIQASVRWDPLDPLAPGPNSTAPTDPSVVPDFGLVMAERIGDVVAPTELKIDKKNLSIRVPSPATPRPLSADRHAPRQGRGRLRRRDPGDAPVAHRPAYRSTRRGDRGAVVARLEPGEATSLPLWVTNLGREAWGQKAVPGTKTIDSRRLVGGSPATRARIVGSWVSLGGIDDPAQLDAAAAASVTPTSLPPAFAPRAVTKAGLVMFAPSTAGDYLLVIDIVTPEVGSLAAQGVEPVTVRVHVAPKPVEPSPSPTVQPTAARAERHRAERRAGRRCVSCAERGAVRSSPNRPAAVANLARARGVRCAAT